jgi:hypothetical protein
MDTSTLQPGQTVAHKDGRYGIVAEVAEAGKARYVWWFDHLTWGIVSERSEDLRPVVLVEQPAGEWVRIRQLVDEQADDPGLWFEARTVPEAYLQAALRALHATIEETVS